MQAYGVEDASSSQNHKHNLQQRIEENLAIVELAEWLLGPYWQTVGAQEQKNFTALLTRFLREIAYPKAAEFLANMRIEYGGEQLNGSEALVKTNAVHAEEGQVRIDYRLRQIQGKWMVWDVLLDGVSMGTNLRSQVQSVIGKKSYQELIKRMQKKLEEG
jgi:phospholipid transport system substrate-binding protein